MHHNTIDIVVRDRKGKGVTKSCSPHWKHWPDLTGRAPMQTILGRISKKARESKKSQFGNLYGLLDEWNLRVCFFELRKRAAPGVDGVDFEQYRENLDENITQLVERLKRKSYRAKLVRRKYIPKPGGKRRPLGIPVIEDKLLQLAVSKILRAIYEPIFTKSSFGYRPGIGPINAVQELTFNLQFGSFGWVVEADIKSFFDTIDHDWLIRMLAEKIKDRALLWLIKKWLKAGILEEDGKVIDSKTGSPQGGVVSPVLSNVFLHYKLEDMGVLPLYSVSTINRMLAKNCLTHRRTGRY